MVENINKKILFIINGLGFGGAETHLLRLVAALLDKGYDINILTLTNDLALSKHLDKRITHINIPLKKTTLFFDLKKILTLVKQQKPNIIHAHLFQANIISRFIKFFNKKIRVINTTHGNYSLKSTKKYFPYKIYYLTKKWVDFHTAVSKESLQLLLDNHSISNTQSKYLPNGLFVKNYNLKKNKNNIFQWVTIGRLHPIKNYSLLVRVCSEIKKIYPDFQLHIAGEGEERKKLEQLIKIKKLENNVKLLGIINDIPNLLTNYNAFIISSNSEGLPMVLLEAMAASLPIVSTKVGEIKNILSMSQGGILTSPNNQEELIRAILKVMSYSDDIRNEIGKNNKKFVTDTFNIENLIDSWTDLYTKY